LRLFKRLIVYKYSKAACTLCAVLHCTALIMQVTCFMNINHSWCRESRYRKADSMH